jgi:hypothetical protein
MSRFDWRSWVALGWASLFAVLYVAMVARERAPWVFVMIQR